MDDDSDRGKLDELLEQFAETKQVAPRLIEKGHNLTEAGRAALDLASAFQMVPNGALEGFLQGPAFHNLVDGLREFDTVAHEQLARINVDTSLLQLAQTSTTSAVVSIHWTAKAIEANTQNTPALQPLLSPLRRNSNAGAVEKSMKSLGLHIAHGATLTPLQHLHSADAAFKRPSADQDYANAVLLPLRHAIQGTIEEFLKARPYPEKASSWVDKVKSVGRHLGKAATPPIQIEMVATTTHTLIDRLSAAKGRVMSREMISALFDESISLLRDIISLVDPAKLRSTPPG